MRLSNDFPFRNVCRVHLHRTSKVLSLNRRMKGPSMKFARIIVSSLLLGAVSWVHALDIKLESNMRCQLTDEVGQVYDAFGL